jgi:hypothetical protein
LLGHATQRDFSALKPENHQVIASIRRETDQVMRSIRHSVILHRHPSLLSITHDPHT